MSMRVIYLPLEPYQERYTEMLTQWTETRLKARGAEFLTVRGEAQGPAGIKVGVALDAFGRCHWSLTQMAQLVAFLRVEPAWADVIYFDDMFTPGFESLPYIFDQLRARPRVFARNHAQSVDPDDFTFPMRRWMRRYEQMVDQTVTGIIVASTAHKEMLQSAMLDHSPIHVLGLPFDLQDVLRRGPKPPAFPERPLRVTYSSRFDAEKQPHLFLDIVDKVWAVTTDIEFVICTGARALRSNDANAVDRARRMEHDGKLRIAANCTRAEYYTILANSRVQLNTARQDFISNTAIEASAFGTPTLAPAFRSFPETLRSRSRVLFAPWCADEAVAKLLTLVHHGDVPEETRWLSREQDHTLDKIIDLFEGAS